MDANMIQRYYISSYVFYCRYMGTIYFCTLGNHLLVEIWYRPTEQWLLKYYYCWVSSLSFALKMTLNGHIPYVANNIVQVYFPSKTLLNCDFDTGSTPVYVPIVVLLVIAIAAITASAGVALACRLRQKRSKEQKTVGNVYCTKVMLRTNGQYSHDGPIRESVVEDGVTLGSGDEESELEEKKNSQAVDV